jgi:hypothetical protein
VNARAAALLLVAALEAPSWFASAQAPEAPSEAAWRRAVHRYLGAEANPSACRPGVVDGEWQSTCETVRCSGGCQVTQVVTVIGYRDGHFRRVSRREIPRGDTGECGCCMSEGKALRPVP